MKKRVLSMFMALALCLTLLPAPSWAAEVTPEGGAIVQEEEQEEQQEAPTVESPAILEQTAENGIAVQDGGDSTVENAVAEVAIDGGTSYTVHHPDGCDRGGTEQRRQHHQAAGGCDDHKQNRGRQGHVYH